jgi:hypothetical protein
MRGIPEREWVESVLDKVTSLTYGTPDVFHIELAPLARHSRRGRII